MILTCPACGTQYVVKDGAIPEGGRQVRCAACRHSWHQDPPEQEPLELAEAVEPVEPEEAVEPEEPVGSDPAGFAGEEYGEQAEPGYEPAEAPYSAQDDAPVGEPVPPPEPAEAPAGHGDSYAPPDDGGFARVEPPGDADDDFSPFAAREPVERRRRSPLLAILVIVLLVGALAAAFWFLAPPAWKARIGLADAGQTPLQLMMTHSDRQALASGNELLAVSGRVINPTTQPQRVPPIQAELRSKTGQVVYRWTIAPPTPTLAPGASARFNSAEVNVPAGGEELTVSLGAEGA